MKKLFFLLMVSASLFSACSKDGKNGTSGKACERDNTATITVTNTSSNPYTFSIDGITKGTLSGYSTRTFTEEAGAWNLRAVQQSGYLFTPTVATDNPIVDACEEWTWQFP
jgi:hypothetical protein